MYEKLRKLNLKQRFSLRTALVTSLTLALLVSATVFMTASAAENVTPTDVADATEAAEAAEATDAAEVTEAADVSPTSFPSGRHTTGHSVSRSEKVSPTDVSASDNVVFAGGAFSKDTGVDPENLGEPVITMTTQDAVGTTMDLTIESPLGDIYVDYGDGTPVKYPGDKKVKGSSLKVYGNIRTISCYACKITGMDVSNCPGLNSLACSSSLLSSIDVSHNTALTSLNVWGNKLTSINVANNPALDFLNVDDNQISSIDVSNNVNLTTFDCRENKLTSIDVSHNTALKWLDISGNKFSAIDVSHNTALEWLFCNDNQLSSLDVSNNTGLTKLVCGSNNFSSLNLSGYSALEMLLCEDNKLTSLDISGCTSLSQLACDNNQLSKLDVSDCSALTEIFCNDNKLTTLDLSNKAKLEYIRCDGNRLTTLNISGSPAIWFLCCRDNKIKAIDLSACTKLVDFWGGCNRFTELDVSACPDLSMLECECNQLTSLDLTGKSHLYRLYCYANNLTALDVSDCTSLDELHCVENYLTFSEISQINSDHVTSYQYAPQKDISIPASVNVGESIDLSSQYSVDGTVSVFKWYDKSGTVVAPATANGGVFTFGNNAAGKTLVCKMTNAKLPDFSKDDFQLATTAVKIVGDPVSSEDPDPSEDPDSSENPVSSEENEDVNGSNIIYYPLAFKQDENVDGVKEALYPEGTMIRLNGLGVDLHSVKGVHLTVGNIETNKKKTVLDAIKHYNEAFDTDTTDIALYDISLEDSNQAHVKVVRGEILVCLKYPDNVARQAEDYVFHLYHQKEDGTIEEIPVTVRRNGIWFRATDFSPYTLYWHLKTVESAGTGESFTLIFVMTVLCALSVAGAGYALYRRKRQVIAE